MLIFIDVAVTIIITIIYTVLAVTITPHRDVLFVCLFITLSVCIVCNIWCTRGTLFIYGTRIFLAKRFTMTLALTTIMVVILTLPMWLQMPLAWCLLFLVSNFRKTIVRNNSGFNEAHLLQQPETNKINEKTAKGFLRKSSRIYTAWNVCDNFGQGNAYRKLMQN